MKIRIKKGKGEKPLNVHKVDWGGSRGGKKRTAEMVMETRSKSSRGKGKRSKNHS